MNIHDCEYLRLCIQQSRNKIAIELVPTIENQLRITSSWSENVCVDKNLSNNYLKVN